MCLCTLYRNTYQQYSTLEESSLFVEDDDISEIGNITLGYVVATQVRTLWPRRSSGFDYTHKYEESKGIKFFSTNSNFLLQTSSQSDDLKHLYFKLRQFYQTKLIVFSCSNFTFPSGLFIFSFRFRCHFFFGLKMFLHVIKHPIKELLTTFQLTLYL